MINDLNNKLDLIEKDIGLKSSVELRMFLLDAREHLLDVWDELKPEEELSLTHRISKIENFLTNKDSGVMQSLLTAFKEKFKRSLELLKASLTYTKIIVLCTMEYQVLDGI